MKLIKQSQGVTSTITKEADRITVTINREGRITELQFGVLSGAEAYLTFTRAPPYDAPIQREGT